MHLQVSFAAGHRQARAFGFNGEHVTASYHFVKSWTAWVRREAQSLNRSGEQFFWQAIDQSKYSRRRNECFDSSRPTINKERGSFQWSCRLTICQPSSPPPPKRFRPRCPQLSNIRFVSAILLQCVDILHAPAPPIMHNPSMLRRMTTASTHAH
jgi:hypothetical protein